MSRQATVKPLPLGTSLLVVVVPAVALYVMLHFVVTPLVARSGCPFFAGFAYLIYEGKLRLGPDATGIRSSSILGHATEKGGSAGACRKPRYL